MEVTVEVGLRLPDGRTFTLHHGVEERYADSQEFWWSEGNGACDCNRSLYLNREHGLNLGEKEDVEDDGPCLPCGNTIALLFVNVGGVQRWRAGTDGAPR